MIFSSIFKRGKSKSAKGSKTAYNTTMDFVEENFADVKALLSSVGYNSLSKHLENIAQMVNCNIVMLCQKTQGPNKYVVVESSNRHICQRGTIFSWTYTAATSSSDASNTIASLPFSSLSGSSFISVPIKNERNVLVGVMIGIAMERLDNLDSRSRLMHILAPIFETEIRYWKAKQDQRQMDQRIESLNQSMEVRYADLQKAQEISIASRELKSIFLTNLSHDIRTPMNAIIGFINLLPSVEDPEERNKFIGIIKESSLQVLSIIDNLIEISKLQSNYMLKPVCPVQLNALLNKITDKYRENLRKMGKDVVVETIYALESPNDTIWNSDEIITKVLEQIMDNACRYTQSGKITLSYSINHKEAIFCVTDTGLGIKEGTEESIFEMFGSEDIYNDKRKGIGLALARKYLMLANGQIWVDTAYREGACFYFSIPTEKL